MKIKKKITNLIGATIIGSVALAAVITTIFLVIFDREQKSGEASTDYRAINAFTEKTRSLLLLFDIAAFGDEDNSVILELLIGDGLAKVWDSFELAKGSEKLKAMYDLEEIESELQKLAESAKLVFEEQSFQAELSDRAEQFGERLDDMDQLAMELAMQDRALVAKVKKVSLMIALLAGVIYVSTLFYVRTRTVKEIVDPIVDLSDRAYEALSTGEKINIPLQGPEEIRKLIGSVQAFANELQTLVDDRTKSLAKANVDCFKQAGIARQLADESQELARRANAANEAKGCFLANMSHEIRTPMNGILGMLTILDDMDLREDQKQLVETAKESSTSLLGIINEILDFSKIEANSVELEAIPMSVSDVAYGAMDLIALEANEKHIELMTQICVEVPDMLLGDPHRIRQVCINLVGNALKFTESGFIKLMVSVDRQNDDLIRLRFEVEDSGAGIPEEKLAGVFDAFSQVDSSTTRNYGGSGLGLSICKSLVELMNGGMAVESKVGQGTTFSFDVEVKRGESEKGQGISVSQEVCDARSLFIESNLRLAEFLEAQFIARGLSFDLISDTENAIRELKARIDSGDRYDYIFIDTNIGEGEAGSIAKNIRSLELAKGARIIEIAPTGAMIDNRSDFDAVLFKPIKERELIKLLHVLHEGSNSGKFVSSVSNNTNTIRSVNRDIRVLVAEDNKMNQKVIRILLKRIGVECDLAVNGKQAIEALEENEYDLVFMDCQMPVMDGFAASREIRGAGEDYRSIPIVALTANALKGYEEKCYESGMDDFITKPISPSELLLTINKWTSAGAN